MTGSSDTLRFPGGQSVVAVALPKAALIAATVGLQPRLFVVPVALSTIAW